MKRLINYMIIFGGKEPHPFGFDAETNPEDGRHG
jgi:hypothetical protein